MKKLVLIDGNSLINRAFYANPPMMTKSGTHTGAVYGFLSMLFKIVHDINPSHLAIAFDVKAPTFRHKMFADYKGTRKPMPEELRTQIPLLKEVLSVMNIKTYEKAGIEADDIIGTIAKSTDVHTIIITGDKDSFQLIDEQTEVYFTKKGITDVDIYNFSNFYEKTGYNPNQVIDMKALMGDSSDNIPGVHGIGDKTALNLIQLYGDIDGVYSHLNEIKGKLNEKLANCKDVCYLSKTLATINVSADFDFSVDDMEFVTPYPVELKKKFAELEFKTFIKKEELFGKQNESNEPSVEKVFIDSVDLLNKILSCENIVFSQTQTINIYTGDGKEYCVRQKDGFFGEGLLFEEVVECLKAAFGDKTKKVITYDVKKIMRAYYQCGVNFNARFDDVLVMKYIADFTGRDETLDDVLEEYGFDKETPAYSLSELSKLLFEKVKEENLEKLYEEVELPLTKVLFSMENEGFKIDKTTLENMGKEFSDEIKNLEARIHLVSGEDFNINSPFQTGTVLFEKLGLNSKYAKKNKRGYSTSAEILEELVDEHEVVPLLLKYRQLQKLYSTYIEGIRPLIDAKTGIVHTCFNQFVTTTGRLSSKDPNLQNIPVRDDLGKEVRKFFVPRDSDRILVSADYSQIELRLLAHFSECETLIKAYNDNEDIHTETASKVFGVDKNEVTPQMRRNAKAVNFGIIYGISEYGLAKNLKIPNSKAKEYITSYFEKYPEVKKYMDGNVAFAKENGYISTLLGRKRRINELSSSNYNVRSFGERAAMNMPLQGSSADIIKIAMVNVFNKLNEGGFKSKLILQVHDELIVDCLKSEQEEVIKLLKNEMENAVKLRVPLTVEIACGETWFDAE